MTSLCRFGLLYAIAFIAALVVPHIALAVCDPPADKTKYTLIDFPETQLANGLRSGGFGMALWYCETTFSVEYGWRAVKHEKFNQYAEVAKLYMLGKNPDFVKTPYNVGLTDYELKDMTNLARTWVEIDKDKPKIPQFAISFDRLTYPMTVATKVRSTVSNGRVTAGTKCDCSIRDDDVSPHYCKVGVIDAAAVSVAVCTKVAQ